MIESKTNLTDETSDKVDLWIAQYKIETGNKIIKPDAINLILEEHFELIKVGDELRVGDIVTIIEDEKFPEKIKSFYGKELKIKKIEMSDRGVKLYSFREIETVAIREFLNKVI